MTQERLSNDEFFSKLSELLSSRKDHGSVFLTQKRLSYDPSNPPQTKTVPRPTRIIKPSSTSSSVTSKSKLRPKSITKNIPSSSISTTNLTNPTDDLTSTNALESIISSLPSESTAVLQKPLPLLIRATNGLSNDERHDGKHIKISTVVEADALEAFFTRYAEVCKSGLGALKKKIRKGKKSKGKKKGKGKGGGTT